MTEIRARIDDKAAGLQLAYEEVRFTRLPAAPPQYDARQRSLSRMRPETVVPCTHDERLLGPEEIEKDAPETGNKSVCSDKLCRKTPRNGGENSLAQLAPRPVCVIFFTEQGRL
jgi:hypothetical protein